jgi:LysM repeat protein
MKRLFILLFILPCFVFAQEKQLIVQGASPNLYINHTVAPKDNYYSIGRLYNISPKEIAAINNLQMDNGLNFGQLIKIPLTSTNFTQKNIRAAGESLLPLYYTVKAKEGLYRVSAIHNKMPIATIKQWNKLATDEISAGANLIIGYLKVKQELSALANITAKPWVSEIVKPKDTVAKVEKKPENQVAVDINKKEEKEQNIAKEMPQPENPKNVEIKEPASTSIANKYLGEGVFKNQYQAQNEVKESGIASIFKSTSGWEDGKYYCLHNTAQPQTIIKITNTATGKTIYAKVMDVMPDIRQNKGIAILISNAAADQLGVAENKFNSTISYSK